MPQSNRKLLLILSLVLILVLPLIVSFFKWRDLPPGFGVFPPQKNEIPDPGFSLPIFIAGAASAAVIAALLLFPGMFGFKAPSGQPSGRAAGSGSDGAAGFPPWFWLGGAICIVSWIIMWGQFASLGPIVHLTFVPLWWGFILALDGLVYRRAGGMSLLARRPRTLLLIALLSCVGWFFFEYLDYFVLGNWYYPDRTIFSTAGYVVWFALAYTTVFPSIFEWYNLLNTFEAMTGRYSNGPKIRLSPRGWWVVFGVGVLSVCALVNWPHPFFFATWIAPLVLLSAALALSGLWTPFAPIEEGNWSPAIIIAMACLFNYFIGEMWNYWSPPGNPNFWKYDVPYVNVYHIFEMPVLGFFGYLPFGILCWVEWLLAAALFGFDTTIDPSQM